MKKKAKSRRTHAFTVKARCEWCEAPFMAKHPRARFCTVAHRSAAKRRRENAAAAEAERIEREKLNEAANAAVKKLRRKLPHTSK